MRKHGRFTMRNDNIVIRDSIIRIVILADLAIFWVFRIPFEKNTPLHLIGLAFGLLFMYLLVWKDLRKIQRMCKGPSKLWKISSKHYFGGYLDRMALIAFWESKEYDAINERK